MMHRVVPLLGWLGIVLCAVPETAGQGYAPGEAAARMTAAPGFSVNVFAAEPDVRQCILVKHDDRGRLWVIQYLQYPNPAGLKRVEVDRYSRTIYDRVPEPPPKGPKGADRITILEDTDGDGQADRFKDFVSDLNLSTSLAFGYGGVFVMQAPYLLFYPDRNRDDVPDGDPEVLLSGFGMEDAQAMANHLTWGPDGWLYGLNGSTTTCRVRGVEFQQGVWRYHPRTREFELFCEGGGNIYGLTFDDDGQLFYSSNGTRPAWHGVQGAYYHKQFEKHGELHNPYTFGYFQFVPHENYRGGHVTCGGSFYYGDTFPPRFRGSYIAANLLAHDVYWFRFSSLGSTFRCRREGELLLTNDTWSAPVDLTVGPDGAVYVADFYDKRTAHPDPDAEWDRTNGRVYRIQAAGAKPKPHVDLNALSSDQLVDRLGDANRWYAGVARRLLAERRDASVVGRLRTTALETKDDHLALEAVWALSAAGEIDDAAAERLLGHRSAAVRYWTVRLEGDRRGVSSRIQPRLVDLAAKDPSPVVRSQLASTAKRLPPDHGLPIVWQLAQRSEDREDLYIPLLLWWAVETKAGSDRAAVLEMFTRRTAWDVEIVREVILPRLVKRYAMERTPESLSACSKLLTAAPADADRRKLLDHVNAGLGGKQLGAPPADFLAEVRRFGDPATAVDPAVLQLALVCGSAAAHDRAIQLALNPKFPTQERVIMVDLLAQFGKPSCIVPLLTLLVLEEQHDVEIAALRTLSRFDDDRVLQKILQEYPRYSDKLKRLCRQALFGRPAWALAFLHAVDRKQFDAQAVAVEELRVLEVFENEEIDELVVKHWGRVSRGTPEEKLADIRRYNNDLRAAPGDAAAGKAVFKEHCAKCHKMFGEGETIGPDLTTANRKDRDYLLTSLVDPSSYIRVEYLSAQVVTTDGRILQGLVTEQNENTVTLVNSSAEKTVIARGDVDEIYPSQISQMAEDVLKPLTPQQLRDLFAFLGSDEPAKSP
ncbi:MAG: c-type cytochrome [Pirellulales bacterium]|nr:c-type cytochrome [Pirellulales bacterium]